MYLLYLCLLVGRRQNIVFYSIIRITCLLRYDQFTILWKSLLNITKMTFLIIHWFVFYACSRRFFIYVFNKN